MKPIRDSYRRTGRLHHAYALVGDREEVKKELFDFLIKDLKFPTKGNPDFWQNEFNTLKIDDSRDLNEAHLNQPVKFDRKVFVIFANAITKDAQNSLLKIFEEPKAETTFFVVLPSTTGLISTLKSRLIIVKSEAHKEKEGELDAGAFLEAKVGKRLTIVTKITKDIKDEKKTKTDVINFLKDMEVVIKNGKKNLLAIEDIEKAISYAHDESPSIRIILEHLAVTL